MWRSIGRTLTEHSSRCSLLEPFLAVSPLVITSLNKVKRFNLEGTHAWLMIMISQISLFILITATVALVWEDVESKSSFVYLTASH